MIDRENVLQQMARRIGRISTVIVGPPGTGKTTLVNAYVKKFGDRRKPLIFLNGRDLSAEFDPESKVWKPLKEKRSEKNKMPLVIIDGLDVDLRIIEGRRRLVPVIDEHPPSMFLEEVNLVKVAFRERVAATEYIDEHVLLLRDGTNSRETDLTRPPPTSQSNKSITSDLS